MSQQSKASELAFRRFIQATRRIVISTRAPLYYPGAGLDIASVLATGATRAYLVDPCYFCRPASGHLSYSRDRIRQAVRAIDPRARFIRHSGSLLAVRFTHRRHRRHLWFIRAFNQTSAPVLHRLHVKRPLYFIKGSFLVFPPPGIVNLKPRAYALPSVFPGLPRFIKPYFRTLLFEQRVTRRLSRGRQLSGKLQIFRDYHCPLKQPSIKEFVSTLEEQHRQRQAHHSPSSMSCSYRSTHPTQTK